MDQNFGRGHFQNQDHIVVQKRNSKKLTKRKKINPNQPLTKAQKRKIRFQRLAEINGTRNKGKKSGKNNKKAKPTSNPNAKPNKIFFGGIDKTAPQEEIIQYFERFGTVISFKVDTKNNKKNAFVESGTILHRGCGTVEFSNKRSMMKVLQQQHSYRG